MILPVFVINRFELGHPFRIVQRKTPYHLKCLAIHFSLLSGSYASYLGAQYISCKTSDQFNFFSRRLACKLFMIWCNLSIN